MNQPSNHTTEPDAWGALDSVLEVLREATRATPFEDKLYLVGGVLRDRILGLGASNDLDLVLTGDAVELARFLHRRGISTHAPVLYPRFGTAMLHVSAPSGDSVAVELVSARAESYQADSRKPQVWSGTLEQDVLRRDFTINTLLQNLHSGEMLDLTGKALEDLRRGVIRTPVDPTITFFDDPLRMLRAVRFAARFRFEIAPDVRQAMRSEAGRLCSQAIAQERIREEFVKMAMLPGPAFRRAMELLLASGLLAQFMPEMLPMVGCGQNQWHIYDVWVHTLKALEALPDDASANLRMALLWHDIGKPAAKSEDDRGVHFYGHEVRSAETARQLMNRLKFSNEEIRDVSAIVGLHMRLGEYKPDWRDAAVKRLIRDCGSYLEDLFTLARCDISATNPEITGGVDLEALWERIEAANSVSNVRSLKSPLDGAEIMRILDVGEGPHLRDAKDFLLNEVIEGRLNETDKEGAATALQAWWAGRTAGA